MSLGPQRGVPLVDSLGEGQVATGAHGRASLGERLVAKVPHGHRKTLMFVTALRVDGVTAAPYVMDGQPSSPMSSRCSCRR